ASTTGTAVNLTNTDVGSSGVTFQSVASNGAANGIVLNTTGSSGQFTVSGTGSAACTSVGTCTGGAIPGSTGNGISLTSGCVSLPRIDVANGCADGINASTVTNLQLDHSLITGNGNAVGEQGLDYTNTTGTTTIASSTITGSAESNAIIANTAAGTSDTINVT